MELYVQALLFGLFSALSLPLGALLGLVLQPSERVVAKWMGLGAGSLVYAVATQLYGKTLFKLLARSPDPFIASQKCDSLCVTLWAHVNLQVATGLLGAAGYRGLNYLMPKCLARISPPRLARIVSTPRSPSLDRSPSLRRPAQEEADEHVELARPSVAISMWLGLVLDGIPESVMLGFMTNSGEVTFSFLLAVFVANFPEAFAGAAALQRQGMSAVKNVALWSSVFFLTGTLAMVGSLAMPINIPSGSWLEHLSDDLTVVLQGFTGGAMLAMVATAMMPEAYHGSKAAAGNLFMLGFGLSVFIDGMGARFGKPQSHIRRPWYPRHHGHNETLFAL